MFGGTSGFGGFGQQQQQQQQQPAQQQGGGLFGGGGFGSTFGAQPATPAFGQQQQQPAQSTGFGGFGAAATSTPAFGAASTTPAFGAPASGGLFGGSSTPAANTGFSFGGGGTSAFGAPTTTSTTTGGGLFGAPKPATSFGGFGAPAAQQPAATGGLFGGGATGGFGAPAPVAPGSGTASVPYQATTVMEPPKEEGKPDPPNQTPHAFQSIVCMPQYANYSFEELRLQDYQANRKQPTASATPSFGGGFGSTTPAFGAAPAATGGLFGASSTPAFGSSAPAATGFGAPQQSSIFGGGATGGFGQQQQQPATGGLFGAPASQPAQTGGLFGSTPTSTPFGQQPAAATSTFGGFGQAPKPASTGFSFGAPAPATSTPSLFSQPAASAPPAGGGLFGQAQTQQPATGGLFGQPAQQASAAPAFSFGAAAAAPKPLFGAAPAAPAASPFGAPAASKPSFSFGAPAAAPAAGGGLFGQQQQQPQQQQNTFGAPAAGGGLFGGGASTFGAQQPAAASPFGGGGLFGVKPAAPATGGLFGQQSTAPSLFGSQPQQQQLQQQPQQQQPSLFGNSFGGSSLGGSFAQSQPQQATAYATADDANAYGSNPLFHSSSSRPPAPVEEKKKPPILSSSFRGTPNNRSSTKITRLRGFGASTSSGASPLNGSPLSFSSSVGGNGFGSSGGAPGTPGSRGSPLRLVNGIGEDAGLSPHVFVARSSVKKLVIDRKSINDSPFKNRGSPGPADKTTNGAPAPTSLGRNKVTFNSEVEAPLRERNDLFNTTSTSNDASTFEGTPVRRSAGSSANLGEDSFTKDSVSTTPATAPPASTTPAANADWPARRPAATPQQGDYFTSPPIDVLLKMPAKSLRAVSDLVVGRVEFGQVAFQEPVDLTTLNSVEDLLGGIVVIEDRNCTVYPSDYEAPPLGQGLNVAGTIRLERCWPIDRATRAPIKDASHPRVVQHIKRLRNLEGTNFIDFDVQTGEWTFAVTSFGDGRD